MTGMLIRIWKRLGILQWYILWVAHHKFILGVSGVILDEQQRILLLRHRYWKTGSWGLPSGYVEHRETLEEALCREVWEETKYTIQVQALIRIVSGYKLRLEASYVGQLSGGELHLDPKEVIEARFLHEMSYQRVCSPHIEKSLLSPLYAQHKSIRALAPVM